MNELRMVKLRVAFNHLILINIENSKQFLKNALHAADM